MRFLIVPAVGLLAGCGDKSSVVVTQVSHPVTVKGLSKQPSVAVDAVPSAKTSAEVSAHSGGGGPERMSGQASVDSGAVEVDGTPDQAGLALQHLRECIEPLVPEIKRRLVVTSVVTEVANIQEWVREECRSQLMFLESFRADADPAIAEALSIFDERIESAWTVLVDAKQRFPRLGLTDAEGQVAAIEAVLARARSRVGFSFVEEEFARWLANPGELNLRDSEVGSNIELGRARIQALRACIDRAEAASADNIVRAFGYSDALVIDVTTSCSAEMRWSDAEVAIYAGAARAAPLIAERLALNERISAFAGLRRGARRLFQTRLWVMGQFTSFVDRHGTLQALVGAVRSLDQNNRADPENYPAPLRPELVRWAAEPLNPYAQVLTAPVSTAAGLEVLAMCVDGRSEPVRESLRDVANAARIQQILTAQLIACYSPMMGLAQFIVQHSDHVSAAEYLAFQVLVRRLYIFPMALTTVIASFRSNRRLSPFNERVANLRAMEGAAEFVNPAVVESLERFRY